MDAISMNKAAAGVRLHLRAAGLPLSSQRCTFRSALSTVIFRHRPGAVLRTARTGLLVTARSGPRRQRADRASASARRESAPRRPPSPSPTPRPASPSPAPRRTPTRSSSPAPPLSRNDSRRGLKVRSASGVAMRQPRGPTMTSDTVDSIVRQILRLPRDCSVGEVLDKYCATTPPEESRGDDDPAAQVVVGLSKLLYKDKGNKTGKNKRRSLFRNRQGGRRGGSAGAPPARETLQRAREALEWLIAARAGTATSEEKKLPSSAVLALLKACGASSEPQQAQEVFEQAARARTPTTAFYAALVRTFKSTGNVAAALDTLEHAAAHGIGVSRDTMNAAIGVCSAPRAARAVIQSGKRSRRGWEAAVELLDGMLSSARAGVEAPRSQSGHPLVPSPNEASYAHAIQACDAAGEVDTARRLFQALQAEGEAVSEESWRPWVGVLARHGAPEEAEGALAHMRRSTGRCDAAAHQAVMREMGRRGAAAACLRVLEALRGAGQLAAAASLQSWNVAIQALVEAGHFQEAIDLCESLEVDGEAGRTRARPDKYTAAAVARSHAELGDGAAAARHAQRMCSALVRGGREVDAAVFNAPLTACAAARPPDTDGVRALQQVMGMFGVPANDGTVCAVVKAAGAAGDLEGVLEALRRHREERGCEPGKEVYTSVMHALMRCGDAAAALEAFHSMRDRGVPCDDAVWGAGLRAAAMAAPAGGASAATQALLDQAPASAAAALAAYAAMTLAARRDGDVEGAAAWASRALDSTTKEGEGRDRALGRAAAGHALSAAAESRDVEGTVRALQQFERLAGGAAGALRGGEWATAVHACELAGDLPAAERLERMEQAARERGEGAGRAGGRGEAGAEAGAGPLRAVQPRAGFRLPGCRRSEVGNGPGHLGKDGVWLTETLSAAGAYEADLSALPILMREAGAGRRRAALQCHCEKKALGKLLQAGVQRPVVAVNIRMCADCHACYAAASRVFDRELVCMDSATTHVFRGGECSCGGCGVRPTTAAAREDVREASWDAFLGKGQA